MIGLVAVFGLILGRVLNQVIVWQLRDGEKSAPPPVQTKNWRTLIGPAGLPTWLALVVNVLTSSMAVLLWRDYGFTAPFWLLLAATLVLIDTGAIDWQVKLIDTLVMLGATIIAVALAPWIISSWISSLLGVFSVGIVFVLLFVIAKILYPRQAAPFGLGDVYLGMFIGGLTGMYNVHYPLFYGMTLAAVASIVLIVKLGYGEARHKPISYGTFLCLGVLLYLMIRPDLF